MTNDREATCSERIGQHLASRAEDVRKMLAVQDGETKVCKHCGKAVTEATYVADESTEAFGLVPDEDGIVTAWEADDEDGGICQFNGIGGGMHEPDEDYHEDSLYEFGLGISRKVVLTYTMSTGGPADWLEILCYEGTNDRFGQKYLEVERVAYHFADWFDHAEEEVTTGPLYELALWVAETQQGGE